MFLNTIRCGQFECVLGRLVKVHFVGYDDAAKTSGAFILALKSVQTYV